MSHCPPTQQFNVKLVTNHVTRLYTAHWDRTTYDIYLLRFAFSQNIKTYDCTLLTFENLHNRVIF